MNLRTWNRAPYRYVIAGTTGWNDPWAEILTSKEQEVIAIDSSDEEESDDHPITEDDDTALQQWFEV